MTPTEAARDRKTPANGSIVPQVLAIDVDLIAKANPDDTATLAELLSAREDTSLVYTSETRSLDGVSIGERVMNLPSCDAVIADGGASVRTREHHFGKFDIDSTLASRWVGSAAIRSRLHGISRVIIEHTYESSRRYSCFPRRGVPAADAEFAIRQALADLDLEIAMFGDRIDISPPGVSTASTLLQLLQLLDTDPNRTVIAGHFVDERLITEEGCWAIVTGEIKSSVKERLVHCPRVHITTAEGAAGLLSGLESLGFPWKTSN